MSDSKKLTKAPEKTNTPPPHNRSKTFKPKRKKTLSTPSR